MDTLSVQNGQKVKVSTLTIHEGYDGLTPHSQSDLGFPARGGNVSQQFSEGNNQPPLLTAFIHWCSGTSGNLAFYVHLIPLTILTHPVESFHIHSHKLYSMLNKFYIRSVSYVI